MTRKTIALALVCLLAVSGATVLAQTGRPSAQASRQGVKAAPSDIATLTFETYTLANGLKIILHQDHRLPLVAVNLWYHVGPANEDAGRTGFAHLFEHMMFQGSKYVPGDAHVKLLEGAGASDINGTTAFDRAKIEAELAKLSLGAVEIRDVDGNVKKCEGLWQAAPASRLARWLMGKQTIFVEWKASHDEPSPAQSSGLRRAG